MPCCAVARAVAGQVAAALDRSPAASAGPAARPAWAGQRRLSSGAGAGCAKLNSAGAGAGPSTDGGGSRTPARAAAAKGHAGRPAPASGTTAAGPTWNWRNVATNRPGAHGSVDTGGRWEAAGRVGFTAMRRAASGPSWSATACRKGQAVTAWSRAAAVRADGEGAVISRACARVSLFSEGGRKEE